MKVIQDPDQLQKEILHLKKAGKTIGFVPTMGNLHAGHLSLVDSAKQNSDIVVASIFVNPMQFGPNEDFDNYPRTMEQDLEKLKQKGTDFVFTPTNDDVYPQGKEIHTSVEPHRLTTQLCGASRPGHFRGVTTVVNILFNIVQPDVAVFGKKDYQQLQVIKAMVTDLRMPITIIGGDIVREDNGLAMSSRNGYLSQTELNQASVLRQTILKAEESIRSGVLLADVQQQAIEALESKGFNIDYFEVVKQSDLMPAKTGDKNLLIAAAAWLGKPRLIDNLEVKLNN